MQHTRHQIIEYLQSNRIATTTELSRVLLVTPANIRHHLRLLKAAKLVDVAGHEPGRGRGRPTTIYGLTDNALQHNLGGLTSALLDALHVVDNTEAGVITSVAKNLLGDFQVSSNRHSQLNQIVEKLNQLKYQAAWEASPSGPRIIFRNCPYALILAKHPEICKIDAAMLATMLNRSVFQSAKLLRSPDGSPHCAFIPQKAD